MTDFERSHAAGTSNPLDDLVLITQSKDLVALVYARRQEFEVQRHHSSI